MKKRLFPLIIIFLSILFLASCSQEQQAESEDTSADITHFAPLNEIKEGQKNIYLLLKVIDSNYWQVIIKGAKAAGDDLGCNIYCGGTSIETDWQGQKILVEEALSKDPDAIILAPDDSIELADDIDRIHDLGIPIILIDTPANTESFDICFMTDNLLAGQNAAMEMLAKLHEAGCSDDEETSVGIMVGTAKSLTVNERLAGFYQYWSGHAPVKWKIKSDIMNCNGDVEAGMQMARDFLDRHPDIDGLYGTNNGPTRAICSVVSEKELTDITVVGFDYSDEIKKLLESPDYRASTILQRQYDMGYSSVSTVLDILDGITPPVRFRDTGVVTVNKESLKKPEIQEIISLN